MMRSLISSGLAAACLTLVAGATAAQVPERVGRASQSAPVSRADFIDRRLAPLAALDADRDGTVTAAERQAARTTRMQAMADRRFERLDSDRNGVISREEFNATGERLRNARPAVRERQRRAGPIRPDRTPSEIGRSGSPRMTKSVVIADVRARIEATFDQLDADRDGTVTAAERQSARAALRERAHARREAVRASRRHAAPPSAPSPSTPASE